MRNIPKQQWLIGLLVVVLIGFAVMLGYGLFNTASSNNNLPLPVRPDYTGDANSGKTPPPRPQFNNFDQFVTLGLSISQYNSLQSILRSYKPLVVNSQQYTAISNTVHKNFPDPNDPQYRWSLSAQIAGDNNVAYQIKVYYWNSNSLQVLIYDATGNTQLFDSGVVTTLS